MARRDFSVGELPGATLMDTGAAGIWGALEDPRVAERAERGAILVNIGNMHTFAVLLRGRRMLGLFEHHTHLLTTGRLAGSANTCSGKHTPIASTP